MSRVKERLKQYKQELEKQTQYKAGLPGSVLDIVNTLLVDLEEEKMENGWIPVNERMPEEHNSIFAKFKGTDNWKKGMFKKTSKYVIAILSACGIDVYVYMTEGVILAADTVHHIIPLKEAWDKRCDKQNLMPLHHDTHSKIEQMYKKERPVMEKKLAKMLVDFYTQTGGAV